MLPFTQNLFGRTLHATCSFVSWDLKKNFFLKFLISNTIYQFYSQRGKQMVLRKLGLGNFHAININFCEVSGHLSALNFSLSLIFYCQLFSTTQRVWILPITIP